MSGTSQAPLRDADDSRMTRTKQTSMQFSISSTGRVPLYPHDRSRIARMTKEARHEPVRPRTKSADSTR